MFEGEVRSKNFVTRSRLFTLFYLSHFNSREPRNITTYKTKIKNMIWLNDDSIKYIVKR